MVIPLRFKFYFVFCVVVVLSMFGLSSFYRCGVVCRLVVMFYRCETARERARAFSSMKNPTNDSAIKVEAA